MVSYLFEMNNFKPGTMSSNNDAKMLLLAMVQMNRMNCTQQLNQITLLDYILESCRA